MDFDALEAHSVERGVIQVWQEGLGKALLPVKLEFGAAATATRFTPSVMEVLEAVNRGLHLSHRHEIMESDCI